MIFAPFALAMALSVIPAFNVATNHGAARVRANIRTAPVPQEYICTETGLIKSWKAATEEDTKQLKQMIEEGMLDDYTTKQIKEEYSRYRKFTNKCLGDKVSGLQSSLKRALERKATMTAQGGGGEGLPAHQTTEEERGDYFQQRYGHDIYDERNDGDYVEGAADELSETMSKITIDDDIKTFVSGVARGGAGRSVSGVSFSGSAGGGRPGEPAGILRRPPARPSTPSTPCSNSSAGGKLLRTFGGSPGYWVVDAWLSSKPCKRLSFQLHLYSCANTDMVTIRTSSCQEYVVVTYPVSLDLTRNNGMLLQYVVERMVKARPGLSREDASALILEHPRFAARMKNIRLMKKDNPMAEIVMKEERIYALGMKLDYEPVSRNHDPILHGIVIRSNRKSGEVHMFAEFKQATKDGFGSVQPDHGSVAYSASPARSTASNRSSASNRSRRSTSRTVVSGITEMSVDSMPESISVNSRNTSAPKSVASSKKSVSSRSTKNKSVASSKKSSASKRSVGSKKSMSSQTSFNTTTINEGVEVETVNSSDEDSVVITITEEEAWEDAIKKVEDEMMDDIVEGSNLCSPTNTQAEETFISCHSSIGTCSRSCSPKKKKKMIRTKSLSTSTVGDGGASIATSPEGVKTRARSSKRKGGAKTTGLDDDITL